MIQSVVIARLPFWASPPQKAENVLTKELFSNPDFRTANSLVIATATNVAATAVVRSPACGCTRPVRDTYGEKLQVADPSINRGRY
jgi:hypothetical protein